MFVGIFKDFGGELPLITQVHRRTLSNLVTQPLVHPARSARSALVVGFRSGRSPTWGRPQWDRLRLRVPVKIGKTVQKIALARWSRTFSALYSAGVPIMQAIEVTGKTAGNTVVERAMDDVIASVKSGGSIAAPLQARPRSSPAWSPR